MKAFLNLSLGKKLLVVFSLLALALVAQGLLSLWELRASQDRLETIYQRDAISTLEYGNAEAALVKSGRALRNAIIYNTKEEGVDGHEQDMKKQLAEFSAALERANKAAGVSNDHPQKRILLAELGPLQEGQAAIMTMLRAGDVPAAKVKRGEVRANENKVADALGALADERVGKMKQAAEEAQQGFERSVWTLGAFIVVVVGFAAVAVWFLVRVTAAPLQDAVRVAEAVAQGDLSVRVPEGNGDETGKMLRALGSMVTGLRGMVGTVKETSNSIAHGANEIAIGNADLSQRTENQASNLEETAASMEELTATVRQNADSARAANQLAAAANASASQGGEVVQQVVDTMAQISASSRRIADIISVIDGIAFQTNILALNAAVESARAGEQGRGFAVVAGEVRSLAQRSAQAAREIKELIGASVERVEMGAKQVQDAGSAMETIVTQIRKVSDLVGEISSASVEQSSGIAQVGQAVQQLDQMTQQNAALVEQSAAAAESLKQQTGRLESVVGQFRL
ncbi:methyl-accepting chemotaxis protein [Roseateles sp.]|jgi:methyl-accepting chemotaxis protein|uniref:methyl-accepting chemotaxis protein n=1 Tax=Roseateles sp. TaxID=1971397 RepID=UPI00391BB780